MTSIRAGWFVGSLAMLLGACGPGSSTVGSKSCDSQSCPTGCCDAKGVCQSGALTSACGKAGAACQDCQASAQVCSEQICKAGGGGGGGGTACVVSGAETCGDGIDNDCNGFVDDGFDKDNDGYKVCENDCDDNDPAVYPGVPEVADGKDNDCDGKVDNHIDGKDYDLDGTPYPQDCNDDEPLVGPKAIEVTGDGVDNNCDGQIDEAPANPCDDTATGATGADFAKAIGICPLPSGAYLTAADFVTGDPGARNIRAKFGTGFTPKQGSKMVLLSSGLAKDNLDDPSYTPQGGHSFNSTATHPLYSAPKCGAGTTTPPAKDLTELKLTMKVPQNAKSFSYQFNFFSAEYPEYVCTQYNDRFIAILESKGIDKTKLPGGGLGQCLGGTGTPRCNVSYDSNGQPLTINNGFFDVCVTASGPNWTNTCSKPISLLAKTGYEVSSPHPSYPNCIVGGATGWLTTKAPVVPGETITLRFIIFDEGDNILDSAVLIDNFKWDATAVTAPVTDPSIN